MLKHTSLLTALLLICGIATAQMNQIKFVEYDLDNGLHVILHQDKSTPIVAVTMMYHVGSKNENPDRTGFAHFFEHLLFEGSENIARGDFAKYVENAGGRLNANTSNDRTFYYELLPSNQLELGLWLESERMLHAIVDIQGVETQREVVKEERRQRVDNQPYGSILEESLSRSFTTHPYKWPVIGSMDHLNAATEDDYKTFYNDFYTPNNAVLSIAGDMDIESTKALISKYFSTIPVKNPTVFRPNIVEPPLASEIRDTVFDNIQLPGVVLVNRIPEQGTEDFYAVSMLNTLMSTGESSRFHKSLVDKEQLAMFVFSLPLPTEDPGVAITFSVANVGVDPYDVEKGIHKEVDKVKTELISETEFQKLRNQIENNFVSSNSTVAGIAESLANYHMYLGDANLINTELNKYLAVTREDIQEAAQKYYTDKRVVLYYIPKQ